MSGEPDNFGIEWSRKKLDLIRRRRELELYLSRWLPELRSLQRGLFIDAGCGCGDLLAMVRELGHDVLGIDAPEGSGGMGDAFLSQCRIIRKELKVPVVECRLLEWIEWPGDLLSGTVAVINSRGALEQSFSDFMDGPKHDVDHRSDNKRWRETPETVVALTRMMEVFYGLLRSGGILLVASNGSANNGWYDDAIRGAAESVGFKLVERGDALVYKWVTQ